MGRPIPKPLPHAVDKRQQKQDDRRAEEAVRREVRRLDQHRCRVCGRRSNCVHEDLPRGAGGAVSLENSFVACFLPDGGLCHTLLQRHQITPVMADGSEPFNARAELLFEMTERIAEIAFEHRPRPAHIRILEGE